MTVKIELKTKQTMSGVKVGPQHNNVVTFSHNDKKCELYFMDNGNLGLTLQDMPDDYLVINKNDLMEFIAEKAKVLAEEKKIKEFLKQHGIEGEIKDSAKARDLLKTLKFHLS